MFLLSIFTPRSWKCQFYFRDLVFFRDLFFLNIIPPPIIIFTRFGQEFLLLLAALFFSGIQYVRAVLYLCSMLVFLFILHVH